MPKLEDLKKNTMAPHDSTSDDDSSADDTSSSAEEKKRRKAQYEQLLATIKLLKERVQAKDAALDDADAQLVKRASAIFALDATNKRQKLDLQHYKNMISTRGITGNKGETIKRKDMFDSKSGCFRS